jgi:diamine N-acetyltransferase
LIKGNNISLRLTRNIDIPIIYNWENNPENWLVSETVKPYSFEEINLLVDSSEDIFENGQLRWIIILNHTKEQIGTLDFFQTDFERKSTHIGILIAKGENRRKGYAKEAIDLAKKYVFTELSFDCLFCSIQSFNRSSIELFKKCGFEIISENKEKFIFDVNSTETILMRLCQKKY